MKQHLNTLFVSTQDAYLAKEGQAVAVRIDGEVKLRVPIHNLGGIVCFGRVGASPSLMGLCGEAGVCISFLTEHGRFRARVSGFTPGNVLLRREQYRRADDPAACAAIIRSMLLGKIANARSVLLRAARDHPGRPGVPALEAAAHLLLQSLDAVSHETVPDRLRGLEGEAANIYFSVFNHLITTPDAAFAFTTRSRRPPLDSVNALLSFLYAMLAHDARAACEAAGLDAAVGFLHRDRPGRPGLALDLMEEFRAFLADRLALSLINRGQVSAAGFTTTESGAVLMNERTRKEVIAAYQRRSRRPSPIRSSTRRPPSVCSSTSRPASWPATSAATWTFTPHSSGSDPRASPYPSPPTVHPPQRHVHPRHLRRLHDHERRPQAAPRRRQGLSRLRPARAELRL